MSADFPLITDLPLADQQEIARIQAIDEDKRTATEIAYLLAREKYITNVELPFRLRKGSRHPNAQPARAYLDFSDDVSDGETVTIGSDVYEFDDDDDVEEGNIQVDISGGATSDDAVLALASAIDGGTEPVTAEGEGGRVTVSANSEGSNGNSIAVSTDCANAEWANGATTLTGGLDAVLANQGEFFFDINELAIYFATTASIRPTDVTWSFVASLN